jgi:DNA repair protein RadC
VQFQQRVTERTARRRPREKFNEDGGERFHDQEVMSLKN